MFCLKCDAWVETQYPNLNYHNLVHTIQYLEVYHHCKHEDGSHEVGKVGQILSIKGLPETTNLVSTCGQEMKESNNGSFKLSSSSGVNGSRRKAFPHNRLTDIGSNEEGNTRA